MVSRLNPQNVDNVRDNQLNINLTVFHVLRVYLCVYMNDIYLDLCLPTTCNYDNHHITIATCLESP